MSFTLQNPIWGYILAVLGLAASIYYGVKSKRVKRISFLKRTRRLVLPRDIITPELHIFFGDKELSDISVSFFTIWNSGNEIIQHDDIVLSKPLEIKPTGNGEILEAQIIKKNDDSCLFNVTTEGNKTRIDFDYTEPSEGILLQVIHTGDLQDLSGKIKGGKIVLFKPERKNRVLTKIAKTPLKRSQFLKLMAVTTIIMAGIVIGFALLTTSRFLGFIAQDSKLYKFLFEVNPSKPSLMLQMLLSWGLSIMYYYMCSVTVSRAFQLGVPSKLKMDE